MVGISVPVPSVDDGAIVAALHIVWALRGNAGLSAALLMSFWRGVGNAAVECERGVTPLTPEVRTRVSRPVPCQTIRSEEGT